MTKYTESRPKSKYFINPKDGLFIRRSEKNIKRFISKYNDVFFNHLTNEFMIKKPAVWAAYQVKLAEFINTSSERKRNILSARRLKRMLKRTDGIRQSVGSVKIKNYKKFDKKFNTSFYSFEHEKLVLNDSNIQYIVGVMKRIYDAKKMSDNKVKVIISFLSKGRNFAKTISYNGTNSNGNLAQRLYNIMTDFRGEDSETTFSVSNIKVLEIVLSNKGGCDIKEHMLRSVIDNKTTYLRTTMKTKDNNCGIQVFRKFAVLNGILDIQREKENGKWKTVSVQLNGVESKDFYPKTLRKLIFGKNFSKDCMLTPDDLEMVADYYGVGFSVQNEDFNIIKDYKVEREKHCFIRLFNDHYELIDLLEKKRCSECYKYFIGEHKCYKLDPNAKKCMNCGVVYLNNHNCEIGNVEYYQKMILKNTKIITRGMKEEKEPEDLSKVLVYDFETFNDSVESVDGEYNDKARVYAVGYKFIGEEDFQYMIGEDTIERFVEYLIKLSEGEHKIKLSAYNGSRFDSYFIMNELNKRGIVCDDLVISSGALIIMRFKKITCFDLCKFLMCPLKKACADFSIKNSKTDFDHTLIHSFKDVETHRDEILEYLKYDILSLEELSQKMSLTFYDKFQIHLHKFVTASNLTYSLFRMKKEHALYIIQDPEKYQFIRESIIGGRTHPLQKYYKSQHFDEVMAVQNSELPKDEKKQILAEIYRQCVQETNDYKFNGDINSLYPAAMLGEFPIGMERVSDQPEKEFYDGKMGIYEIDYIANKQLMISPFPQKTESGRLEWCVKDGRGIFNSIDIKNAISMGYQIKFIKTCIVWDQTAPIIKNFIEMIYEWKKQSKGKNKTAYALAKLLMNSLYGKFLQGSMDDAVKQCSNIKDVYDFMRENEITDYENMNSGVLLKGKKKNFEKTVTKPNHLGSFILGYSREIMLKFMRVITPSLRHRPFTYSDTDSLHFGGEHYKKFVEMGLVDNTKLGMMANDIGDYDGDSEYKYNIGPIILNEVNLAPKNYCYWYISASGEFGTTMKSKGIPKETTDQETGKRIKLLNTQMYIDEAPVEKKYFSFRKIHKTLWSTDKKKNFDYFSIIPQYNVRTFNKTPWTGMNFNENTGEYTPKGYRYKSLMEILKEQFKTGIDQLVV